MRMRLAATGTAGAGNTCFAHLGRVLGLYGSNYAETVKVEQCLCQVRRRCSVPSASLAPAERRAGQHR